jgi:hypothetical protein
MEVIRELWGHAEAQVVEVLCYNLEGRGSRPDDLDFLIYLILPAALWSWVRLNF